VSLLLFVMTVVPTMLAAFQLWRATQGLDAIKRIVRLDTTPLRDIREGAVEVEGFLEALEPRLLAASGRDAVFADVEVKATRGGGRNSVVVHQSHTQRSVATAITSSDGTKVKLDFSHLEVVGTAAAFVVGGVPNRAEPTRAWAADVPTTATSIQFKERVLQPGARVVVSGIARLDRLSRRRDRREEDLRHRRDPRSSDARLERERAPAPVARDMAGRPAHADRHCRPRLRGSAALVAARGMSVRLMPA
jgi:hypothetical protein